MGRPSVLVVEKDEGIREVLTSMLQEKGYEVHTVGSRAAGFDALDDLCPDLLILDDPAQERAYRLVWLRESDQPDVRIELVDPGPQNFFEQLNGLLKDVA